MRVCVRLVGTFLVMGMRKDSIGGLEVANEKVC